MDYFGVSGGSGPSAPSSPGPRPPAEAVDKLRGRLLDLGSSFVGFEKIVEEDTLRRRQIEQQRMQDVLDGLTRFEKALNVEIRRRIETSKATQEGMEQLLSDMLSNIQSRILQRFERLGSSIESLFERCSTLERGIQQLRGELPTKFQVESNNLVQQIKEMTIDFENDRKQKLEQDSQLLRTVAESEHSVDIWMEQELEMLEKRAEALESAIDEMASEGEAPETGSRARILQTVAQVRAGIGEEARCRERTDDDVVQAINEYTNALHRSLSKANT